MSPASPSLHQCVGRYGEPASGTNSHLFTLFNLHYYRRTYSVESITTSLALWSGECLLQPGLWTVSLQFLGMGPTAPPSCPQLQLLHLGIQQYPECPVSWRTGSTTSLARGTSSSLLLGVFPGVREVKVNLTTLSHESFSGTVQSAVQSWFWPAASYRRQFVLTGSSCEGRDQ